MKAEGLNRRVTIQQQSSTQDASGQVVDSWSDVDEVWTTKAHAASREFFAAQKVNAEITDLFTIRYRSGVTTKMRLLYDSKYYDILGADDPTGKRRELQLLCKLVM